MNEPEPAESLARGLPARPLTEVDSEEIRRLFCDPVQDSLPKLLPGGVAPEIGKYFTMFWRLLEGFMKENEMVFAEEAEQANPTLADPESTVSLAVDNLIVAALHCETARNDPGAETAAILMALRLVQRIEALPPAERPEFWEEWKAVP